MVSMICGAAVFAAGCLFGGWLILVGQQSKTNRTAQTFQEAFAEALKKANERTKDVNK